MIFALQLYYNDYMNYEFNGGSIIYIMPKRQRRDVDDLITASTVYVETVAEKINSLTASRRVLNAKNQFSVVVAVQISRVRVKCCYIADAKQVLLVPELVFYIYFFIFIFFFGKHI